MTLKFNEDFNEVKELGKHGNISFLDLSKDGIQKAYAVVKDLTGNILSGVAWGEEIVITDTIEMASLGFISAIPPLDIKYDVQAPFYGAIKRNYEIIELASELKGRVALMHDFDYIALATKITSAVETNDLLSIFINEIVDVEIENAKKNQEGK